LNLFVFGLGYTARYFAAGLSGAKIVGTTREPRTAEASSLCCERVMFDGARGDPAIPARLAKSDTLLVSIPPSESGDLVLANFLREIAARRWRAIVYLSTVGVYGDHGGAWVDETSEARPSSSRTRMRIAAEGAWRALGRENGAPVHILRLAGIYGPGRNALINLREGTAKRIVKPGQVFNRIHVADIAQVIELAIEAGGAGDIWNVADDEPAPPQDVIAFAAALLETPAPAEEPFESVEMTAMARSFYSDNRRVSNAKLKRELGFRPLYPTYREGLRALAASSDGGPA
jgi:nucleoside-diphosphate-sugar epimerase